jgi:hypothetical protein
MPDGPRRHHYLFCHRELPFAAFHVGGDLVSAARQGHLTLTALWNKVGQTLPEDQRLRPDGLAARYHPFANHDVILVSFPRPQAPTEAYFAAIAVPINGRSSGVRYLTLEAAVSPLDGARYNMIGEWTRDGAHGNLGSGPAVYPDAFLDVVVELLDEQVPQRG